MQIPQQTIETIRERIDIAEVVSRYVELRRTGTNFKGLCPFHQEKTPSFVVSPEKQIFHCFGCDKGGNVFVFLMEIEGVSFPEAVRSLGRQCGVEVESRPVSKEEQSKNDARFGANTFAARFYHRMLMDAGTGARARKYLIGRGIPEPAWKTFSLGYAPEGWDRLWVAARREGIGKDVLAELRLVIPREKSTGYYDYFRSRIIFPIVSVSNRVIAFGARTLADDVEPKYLNSSESPIFAKRRTFFGMDRARDAVRERKSVVVVEGYTDFIALHLAGLENTVATCGTALTPEHATVLRRLTQSATLVPDADSAGQNAAVAAGAVLAAAGMEVRVARLEPGKDPDTAARELGSEEFSKLIDGSIDYFDYLNYIIKEKQVSPREKEAMIRRIMSGIAQVDDKLRYDVIVKEFARVFEVDPASLRVKSRTTRDSGGNGNRSKGGSVEGEVHKVHEGRLALEKLALRLILEGTAMALEAIDSLDIDEFCTPSHKNFYKQLDLAQESHIDIRSRAFQRQAEEAGLEGLAAEIALISLPPGNVDTLLKDTIRRIKVLKIRDELDALRERLRDLPSESEEAVAVAEYYYKLKQALVEL